MSTDPKSTETEEDAADTLRKVLALLSKLSDADRARVVETVAMFYRREAK